VVGFSHKDNHDEVKMELIIKDAVDNFNKLKVEVSKDSPNIITLRLLIHDIDHLINLLKSYFGW
jgi:hypothetical protein